jgi:hypothetical protein
MDFVILECEGWGLKLIFLGWKCRPLLLLLGGYLKLVDVYLISHEFVIIVIGVYLLCIDCKTVNFFNDFDL